MLIGDVLKFSTRRFKHKIAFKDEKRQLSFDQVAERSNRLGNGLMRMGNKRGDRIAVLLYNCTEYNELLFSLPGAGFALVPLNYRFIGRELAYIINNSEANTLIFGDEFSQTIDEIRPEIPGVENYIIVGPEKTEALNYENLINDSSSAGISTNLNEDDIAYILYTSGTTGPPKGAMLTHKNIITNLINEVLEVRANQNDRIFNLPPLYHCAGQCATMTFFFCGATTLTVKQFDPELTLVTLQDERPNVLHLVPAMQNMVINHPDIKKYDLSSVQLMIYGASSMMVSQLKRSMDLFSCKFIQFGGLTEASPILTALRPEDHIAEGPETLTRKLGSTGKEVKLTEVRIVDEEGHEVPPDTPGEEIARGDNIMKGYWKMPEATSGTIVGGWLHTGDICVRDEEGYIYYVDRIKDMIVRGGENVYPREIEEIIATHPAVLDVAVIGVPDQRMGEEIMAVIVPKEGRTVSEEEIVDLCVKNLARYKKPRFIEYVESLPKNPSGKILKRELRKKYKKSMP